MHLHEAAAPSVAFRYIRASYYCRSFFLLLQEHLDACSAHLADDDRLGGSEADRTAVGFLRANQFAVDRIELDFLPIVETTDSNDAAVGCYNHTAHFCRVDVIGCEVSVSLHPIELSRGLVGCFVAVSSSIDADVVTGGQIHIAVLVELVALHIRAAQRVVVLCARGGVAELQLSVCIANRRFGTLFCWFVVTARGNFLDIFEILPPFRILISFYVGNIKRTH